MTQVIGYRLVGGDESSERRQRLAERTHDEVYVIGYAEMVACAASLTPEHTDAVGLVHHDGSVVLLGQTYYLRQVRHVAFHGEHTVGDYQLHLVRLTLLQLRLKALHVVMLVLQVIGKRQPASLDNRRMVLLVQYDVILTSSQGRYHTKVHAESSGIYHGVLLAYIVGQTRLQILVDSKRAVQEWGTGKAGAVFAGSLHGRLDNLGMIGQSHIGIRPEHQHLPAVDHHLGVLLARYRPEIRVNTCRLGLLRRVIRG